MIIKILGVKINLNKKDEVLEEVRKYLTTNNKEQITNNKNRVNPLVIFTPNPEIINYAQKDLLFKQIVNSAQINIPDGAGLCFAIEKKFHMKTARLSGTDLMMDFCNLSSKNSFTIGLIGGRGDVAVATRECLLRDYPNLKIEVLEAPEFRIQNSEFRIQNKENKILNSKLILNSQFITLNSFGKQNRETEGYFKSLAGELMDKKIDILFVALGFPKQEYFIELLRKTYIGKDTDSSDRLNMCPRGIVMMGVGGAFDYISGRVKRAPFWMRKKGLEWMFRLLHEPKRIIRMLRGSVFFYRIFTR